MEKPKEIKLELLKYLKENAIILGDGCIPNYQSKRFTSDEKRIWLNFLARQKLISEYLGLNTRYADITPEGEIYLEKLEEEKAGFLKRNLMDIVYLIFIQFLVAILAGLLVLFIEYFVFLKYPNPF